MPHDPNDAGTGTDSHLKPGDIDHRRHPRMSMR
jgi:hypothetical protein